MRGVVRTADWHQHTRFVLSLGWTWFLGQWGAMAVLEQGVENEVRGPGRVEGEAGGRSAGRLVQQQPGQGAAEAPKQRRDGETDARDVRKEEITDFGG